MDGGTGFVNRLALTDNAALMDELAVSLKSRDPMLPGIGVFYGPSGFGKSMAATLTANEHDCAVIQVKSTYTTKHFFEVLAVELGLSERGTIAQLADRIAEALIDQDRMLIVDEADHLVERKIIEALRGVYDSCECPMILIGEELLPHKLQRFERVWRRVHEPLYAAQPASRHDIGLMAEIYCPGVTIEPALFDRLVERSGPSLGRAAVNLNSIRHRAIRDGKERMDIADFDDFKAGEPPKARRFR